MTKNFTHIVEIFLWDRPNWKMLQEYLEYRLDFFHKYTLKSILNQTVSDYLIFMQLGDKFKDLTEAYNWNKNVIRCYNYGKDQYKNLNTKYLVISRIDSDDLFRRTALEKIRNGVIFDDKKRTVAVFRKNICWDMINDCIVPHRKVTSPFFTHVFPHKIYKKWDLFKDLHFCEHGNHGAGDRTGRSLPENQVCVVKHGQNISHIKRNLPPFVLQDDQKEILKAIGKSDNNMPFYDEAIWDHKIMSKILNKFGVEYEV